MSHALVAAADPDPAAAISRIRDICAGLPAHPGVLLGEPGIPAWLVRTALTAGEVSLAADVTQAAGVLARANPGVPGVTAAAAHSLGLLDRDPGQLAAAAASMTIRGPRPLRRKTSVSCWPARAATTRPSPS